MVKWSNFPFYFSFLWKYHFYFLFFSHLYLVWFSVKFVVITLPSPYTVCYDGVQAVHMHRTLNFRVQFNEKNIRFFLKKNHIYFFKFFYKIPIFYSHKAIFFSFLSRAYFASPDHILLSFCEKMTTTQILLSL